MMGSIKKFLSRMRFLDSKSNSGTPPQFENLEPRIMLSADSLLSSLNTTDPIDNSLYQNNQQTVLYADLLDTDVQCQISPQINETPSALNYAEGLIANDDITINGIIFDTHELSLTIEPEQIDDLVNVSSDRSRYDRQTGQFSFNTTIVNTSSTSIQIPM